MNIEDIIIKTSIYIFVSSLIFSSCSIDRNPLQIKNDSKAKIVINEFQAAISVEINPDNEKLESKVFHLVKYQFENCYGIINDYTVEVDTFGGMHYNMDYFQPFSPNNDLFLTDTFWMATDFKAYNSIVVYFRLQSMFWEDSVFSSEFLGGETIKYSIPIQITR